MTVSGIRSFARKGQMLGMGLMLGSTLLAQTAGVSTAVAAEAGTAKKGLYCTSWAAHNSGNGLLAGKVRSCLEWWSSTGAWHVLTHTKDQAAAVIVTRFEVYRPSERDPAHWTATGTVQINSKESISYSHKKKQVTHGAGYESIIKQGIECGNRTVTRAYHQHGPVYRDTGSAAIDVSTVTLNIQVPCV
ncbi:hypothetical protein [Streptomyces sp. NPDC058603]|uniref:hypothetical protein n=1 Tax=unclassified Streptomyces TaxID=2593676 RepID=UPI003647E09A